MTDKSKNNAETQPAAPGEGGLLVLVQGYFPDTTPENLEAKAVEIITRQKAMEGKLIAVAKADKNFAKFLDAVLKGMKSDEAIARYYDRDLLTPPEGSPDWDRIKAANDERLAEMSATDERVGMLEKNRQVSVENAAAFIADTGLSQEDATKFLDWYDKLKADEYDGLLTKDHFAALYKAYTYEPDMAKKDSEMAKAVETAKAAGRNEAVEMGEYSADNGDGIPKLGTSGSLKERPKNFTQKFLEDVF